MPYDNPIPGYNNNYCNTLRSESGLGFWSLSSLIKILFCTVHIQYLYICVSSSFRHSFASKFKELCIFQYNAYGTCFVFLCKCNFAVQLLSLSYVLKLPILYALKYFRFRSVLWIHNFWGDQGPTKHLIPDPMIRAFLNLTFFFLGLKVPILF